MPGLSDIKLEDIDFDKVAKCTDKAVIKRYLKLLEDDGNYFHDLIRECKNKLLELDPKAYYHMFPRATSAAEIDEVNQDLLNWADSVTETDDALKNIKKKADKDAIWDRPAMTSPVPIRGQEAYTGTAPARPNLHRAEQKSRDEEENPGKAKDKDRARDGTSMKDYYKSWDSVDVDKMEKEMEDEERKEEEARKAHFDDLLDEQEASKVTTPINVGNLPDVSRVPEAHRRYMSDSEKEKGNEAFYAKDFEEAEAYYTRSLHYTADDCSTWANRALVRLKMQKAELALQDCEHALALDPRYMKALHRKGKSLYDLNRIEEAIRSFQLALAESPGNTQINGDLMVARRRSREAGPSGPPAARSPGAAPASRAPRVNDPPATFVEEVLDDEPIGVSPPSAPAAFNPPVRSAAPPAGPSAGYTRVAIEEDSGSDSEGEEAAVVPTFRRVQIEDVSGSESEEDGSPAAAAPPPPASVAPPDQAASGFRRVDIVDDGSDSDGDAEVAASASAPPARPPKDDRPPASVALSPADEAAAAEVHAFVRAAEAEASVDGLGFDEMD